MACHEMLLPHEDHSQDAGGTEQSGVISCCCAASWPPEDVPELATGPAGATSVSVARADATGSDTAPTSPLAVAPSTTAISTGHSAFAQGSIEARQSCSPADGRTGEPRSAVLYGAGVPAPSLPRACSASGVIWAPLARAATNRALALTDVSRLTMLSSPGEAEVGASGAAATCSHESTSRLTPWTELPEIETAQRNMRCMKNRSSIPMGSNSSAAASELAAAPAQRSAAAA
eukprot:CAMPEP_0177581786 /NCGR_PEP_ID=MMETSP0419_2-20121207/2346_1 /TAXON_ID=582737 /ORGANISM="Tetraselmis sp., Strain GSL018" /LENGTH=231 /DNA_ID=CAMNT_0019070877 /DNA_START=395 /DNA_END=1087 /DNA_ORIENTATION=+